MRRCGDFNTKIRVLLVDDNYDHLMGIRELINLESEVDVVAAATNANVAINLIKKYQPEIVLMDMFSKDELCKVEIPEIEENAERKRFFIKQHTCCVTKRNDSCHYLDLMFHCKT